MKTSIERFEEKFRVVADCWYWTGAVTSANYGCFVLEGKLVAAHRAAWILYKGPIPEDLWVLHKCDIPLCVNPAHLYIGTRQDNTADAIDRKTFFNASKTECKRGHPLSGDNLYIAPSGKYRMCRICQQGRVKSYYEEHK